MPGGQALALQADLREFDSRHPLRAPVVQRQYAGFVNQRCQFDSDLGLRAGRCALGVLRFCKAARRFDSDDQLHSLLVQGQYGRLLTVRWEFDSLRGSFTSVSSSGKDAGFSTQKRGFDSPHRYLSYRPAMLNDMTPLLAGCRRNATNVDGGSSTLSRGPRDVLAVRRRDIASHLP